MTVRLCVGLAVFVGLVAPAETRAEQSPLKPPPGITVQHYDAGEVLADEQGWSLYVFECDSSSPVPAKSENQLVCSDLKLPAVGPGVPHCVGRCTEAWPPVYAKADAVAEGDFTLVGRADGRKQWAFRGWPLHRYGEEFKIGQSWGDGGGFWNVARPSLKPAVMGEGRRMAGEDSAIVVQDPPAGVSARASLNGDVFADSNGMTLYVLGVGKDGCQKDCLFDWAPYRAPALARARGDWTIVAHADGTRQWVYRGQPLYTSQSDTKAGDLKGLKDGARKPQPARP